MNRTFFRMATAALCAALLLSLAGCEKPDKPNPNPTPNPDPEPKPTAPFFKADLPAEWVSNVDGYGTTFGIETNIPDWTVSSDAEWCSVTKNENNFVIQPSRYEVKNDEGAIEYVAPRVCTVTVKAGTVFNKTIKVAQQSWTFSAFLESEKNSYVLTLSPDGETHDVLINTNVYFWQASTEADWLTLQRVDNGTLRVTSQARPESVTNPRSAKVTLITPHDLVVLDDFTVVDGEPALSGPDYGYGDGTGWDE